MSLESVHQYFATHAPHIPVIEMEVSTATVTLAAEAHGVEPGRIAKTLAFRLQNGEIFLLVARGDARIDNKKFKDQFGKGKMLPTDEVEAITSHPVGGVCPFGLPTALPIYLDVSMQAFEDVLPAAGAVHSAVRIGVGELASLTQGTWVDVCQPVSQPSEAVTN